IGLLIAFTYALAGIAVAVAFRRVLFASAADLLLLAVWPLLGAAFNVWVFAASVRTLSGTQLAIGLGALAVGLVPLGFAWLRGERSFFRPRPLHPNDTGTAGASAAEALPTTGPADGRRDGLLSDF
ncbi:APC family permease, partial [Streptomyces sp. NPDC059556]